MLNIGAGSVSNLSQEQILAKTQEPGTLKVKVVGVEGVLFEGEAKSVSSMNKKGKFDILPAHENFISIIQEKVALDTVGGAAGQKPTEFEVKQGVLRVKSNRVDIFLGVEHRFTNLMQNLIDLIG